MKEIHRWALPNLAIKVIMIQKEGRRDGGREEGGGSWSKKSMDLPFLLNHVESLALSNNIQE
jgi:hypothetical protein